MHCAIVVLLIATASCGVDQISDLFTFSISRNSTIFEPKTDTAGATFEQSFALSLGAALDSNGTNAALVHNVKLDRAIVISSASNLQRFKNIQLYASSDSMSERLVASLATVLLSQKHELDLAPQLADLHQAFAAEPIRLRLKATLVSAPVSDDSLSLVTHFAVLAEPVSPP